MTWRRKMTANRKREIWEARGGLCGRCSLPVPQDGPDVEYDHYIPGWITESDDDDNVWPLHSRYSPQKCHAVKTKQDLGVIAHIKRLLKKNRPPEERAKPRRPIRSRGFDATKTRHFDGSVSERKRR